MEYSDGLAQTKIGYEKLHRRPWCPEDMLEALATMDNMCILFIKGMPQPGEPP
jgi:hypothetical protein